MFLKLVSDMTDGELRAARAKLDNAYRQTGNEDYARMAELVDKRLEARTRAENPYTQIEGLANGTRS